jgi:hypothetical protein
MFILNFVIASPKAFISEFIQQVKFQRLKFVLIRVNDNR